MFVPLLLFLTTFGRGKTQKPTCPIKISSISDNATTVPTDRIESNSLKRNGKVQQGRVDKLGHPVPVSGKRNQVNKKCIFFNEFHRYQEVQKSELAARINSQRAWPFAAGFIVEWGSLCLLLLM